MASSQQDERAQAGAAAEKKRDNEGRMRTYSVKASDIERRWWVVDADGATLGRLATRIASALRGKHKATFTDHLDVGDAVVVVNAGRVRVTGKKLHQKQYVRHSGYPGGFRAETLERLLARRPEEVIRRAVRGMLPRNRLGDRMIRKLYVYAGPDHPHAAQRPEPMPQPERSGASPHGSSGSAGTPGTRAEGHEMGRVTT